MSGIVAVPYNDIVARSIPSNRRSRMLAFRFFGGGLLAMGVAAAAHQLITGAAFPRGYAILVLLGAALLFISACCFVASGEPEAPEPRVETNGFPGFLREGLVVFRDDRHFRLFAYSQPDYA